MAKPYDTRLIMMVSQMPFETSDLKKFCKLLPMVYVDGARTSAADFPNDGEIWWMLTARTAPLAISGKLVVGTIENAVRYVESDSTSSSYQAQRDSVRELDQNDGLEVVTIPSTSIDSIEELVATGRWVGLETHPTAQVMARWRGQVYGPFRTSSNVADPSGYNLTFGFTPASADMTVYQLAEPDFDEATKAHRLTLEEQISPTMQRRSDAHHLQMVRHELLLGNGFDAMFSAEPKKLMLEPIGRKLMRFAKHCLTRKKSQAFRTLLDEIELTGREREGDKDLIESISRVKQSLDSQDAALHSVARALLESGILGEDRIRRAEQAFAEKYVQEQAAQLQAKVQETLKAVTEEVKREQANLKDVQSRLQREESDKRAKLDRELQRERAKANEETASKLAALDAKHSELERQEAVLRKNLEQVTDQLRTAGDEVINRFLTIAPLLRLAGITSPSSQADSVKAQAPPTSAESDRGFDLPKFVRRSLPDEAAPP